MRRGLPLGALLWAAATLPVAAQVGTPATDGGAVGGTVIVLVRHAETAPDGSRDPALSAAGHARADRLAAHLRAMRLGRVHTSPYRRTRDTAAPTARVLGLEALEYDPRDLPGLAARLREEGGRHLVVGHSNTTPQLVELLGGDPGPELPESEYDRLYVLVLGPDGVRTLLLRY